MTSSLPALHLCSSALTALLAFYWLATPVRHRLPMRLLGANFLLFAVIHLLAWLQHGAGWSPAGPLRAVLVTLSGAAFWLYFSAVTTGGLRLRWYHSLMLLPPIAAIGLLVFPSRLTDLLDAVIIGSLAAYPIAASFRLSRSGGNLPVGSRHSASAWQWLLALTLMLITSALVDIVAVIEIRSGTPPVDSTAVWAGVLSFSLFSAAVLLMLLWRLPVVSWMEQLLPDNGPQLEEGDAASIYNRWLALLDSQQLHRREGGITILQAARKLGVPQRQLSRAINQVYGGSFSRFLNDRRIELVTGWLDAGDTRPLTELMQEAGFTTKSAFNREFQRVTGVAPSAYRQKRRHND